MCVLLSSSNNVWHCLTPVFLPLGSVPEWTSERIPSKTIADSTILKRVKVDFIPGLFGTLPSQKSLPLSVD